MQYSMFCVTLVLLSSSVGAVQLQRESGKLPVQPTQGDEGQNNPMSKVLDLLTDMRQRTSVEGRREQQSYDKYACWCENTLERKANDIATAKQTIEDLSSRILELSSTLGTAGAEIKNLKQDIADNQNSQKEATDQRNKEHSDYNQSKEEAEQSLQALEMAIKVLTEGTKPGFLQVKEARLMSVVDGLRQVVQQAEASETLAEKDLEVVKEFVAKPEEFVKGQFSAAQTGSSNPFGDYSSQSSGVQGILKGMYDAMATGLEKDNAEEANHEKSYRKLMATKKTELEELSESLKEKSAQYAADKKENADSKMQREELSAQLAADEKFFDETKTGCRNRAKEWATRSRLRSEEIKGIDEAMKIINDNDATFKASAQSFLQIESSNSQARARTIRGKVFKLMKTLTKKYQTFAIGSIAAEVKSGGTFDRVVEMIDKLLESLRAEEKEDEFHRDRCEMAKYKSHYESQGLIDEITKLQQAIKRMDALEKKLNKDMATYSSQMEATKAQIKELEENRAAEVKSYKAALEADKQAVQLIGMVIEALGKFYANNGIALIQKDDQGPKAVEGLDVEYTVDRDKAPELSYDGADYGGRQGTNRDITALLNHIQEDTKNEIKDLRNEDAEDEAEYQKQYAALKETLDEQEQLKNGAESQLAEIEAKEAEKDKNKDGDAKALEASQALEKSLARDCDWVDTHFDSRREKRKAEMDGLQTAKEYLQGKEASSESEDDLE